jgi:hypothetical protein
MISDLGSKRHMRNGRTTQLPLAVAAFKTDGGVEETAPLDHHPFFFKVLKRTPRPPRAPRVSL